MTDSLRPGKLVRLENPAYAYDRLNPSKQPTNIWLAGLILSMYLSAEN